jgi:hypothetical protein
MKSLKKRVVRRAIKTLKVVPRGVISQHFLRGQAEQLDLANAEVNRRHFLGCDSSRAQQASIKQILAWA